MQYAITDNQDNFQFEITEDGHKAELVYRLRDKQIYLMHTWVPEQIGGKGIGKALIEHALKYSIENQLEAIIYCPFVNSYVIKHPNWREELAN